MDTYIILPTQLYPRTKTFWNQWSKVVMIEDDYYINKNMHPLKLWMHRASMMEYFEAINHKSKSYITYDQSFKLPPTFTICHPTDKQMVSKYSKGTFIDGLGFILPVDQLHSMDTSSQDVFYKRMRVKLDILMNGSKPVGNKWSYDSSNRQKYPTTFNESNPLHRSFKNKFIDKARSIIGISTIKHTPSAMICPTNRKAAMKDLKDFVKYRLSLFGPYQDAIRQDIVVGYHSCISAPLNIGLITPNDIIKETLGYKIPIQSLEGFIRQVIGWREYIRMKYVLHGPMNWSYLNKMNNPIDNTWYSGSTGIETLDWSIERVVKYAYAPHIERLMLLLNYGTLLQLKYEDVKKWFITMFIDGYEWVMLNVSMGVNSLNPDLSQRFMKRAYLTNGTYLKKMGLKVPNQDMEQLKQLYNKFIKDNKALAKKDYRLAAAVKRLT